MNLYLIRQSANQSYDSYDSAVVAAENEDDARSIHPHGGSYIEPPDFSWTTAENVVVIYLGRADENTPRGVICASFNAG